MRDYIKQLIESLVKDPARGVPKGTNLKITYRAGEKLDRAMKYFNDFKSQRKKIHNLMHSAEMDSDGNLVITPKSTQGAKKIRSIMQDVLAPREEKQETNEARTPQSGHMGQIQKRANAKKYQRNVRAKTKEGTLSFSPGFFLRFICCFNKSQYISNPTVEM